jgi:VirK protein
MALEGYTRKLLASLRNMSAILAPYERPEFATWVEPMRGLNNPKSIIIGGMVLMAVGSAWAMRTAVADEPNHDFAALEKAVLDGKDFRMVIDLSACQVHGTDKPGPPVRGSARFDGVMIQSDDTMAFSTTHFTVRADKTPVSEFLSYRVHPTGKVNARTVMLNPATYAILQESEFDCEIGKSVTFHW